MTLLDGRSFAYQWDIGLKVSTTDAEGTIRRFGNEHGSKSIPVEAVTEDTTTYYPIPNILLATGRAVIMYSLGGDGENTIYTSAEDMLPVYAAPKPDDYIFTEDEVKTWRELDERLTQAEEDIDALESGKSDVGHTHTESEITDLRDYIPSPAYPEEGDVVTWNGSAWVAGPGGGGGAPSYVIDLEKYGITKADYTEPFTEENYNVAHANGVGIQAAIDDAKAAGATKIILPAGNYPLCYESDANTTYNAVIDASDIDFYGEGAKLYVIFDEGGTNPYFTGDNPRELCGVVIVTNRDVHGFHLVGERAYRHRSDSAPWKDESKGIGLTKDTDGNKISNCFIELFSGDGIGNRSYMTQLAGWTSDADALFTSVDWDNTSEEFVASAYKFTSIKHGAYWIDQTKPLLVRSSSYYLYSAAPLRVLCFDQDENYIGDIRFWQGEYFYFLPGTYYWYLQLTREIAHDTSMTETWPHFIGVGKYQRTTIEGCEIRLNQRGGLSNLPNGSVIKDCLIHTNGGAYGEMWAYYDSTQFGIDIEDIYIHNFTIQNCVFARNLSAVLYRCWGINILDCTFYGNVNSLNFCGDFFAKNTLFANNCAMSGSIPHGKKIALGCRFHGTKADEIEALDGNEFYIATYGTTTLAQAEAAIAAGKTLLCDKSGTLFTFGSYSANTYVIFMGLTGQASTKYLTLGPSGWTESSMNLVPTSRTVNGKTLGADVTLASSDVGAIAAPSSPSSGQVLTWDGSAWTPQTPSSGSSTIVSLSDVYIATYNSTSLSDLDTAYAAGKKIFLGGTGELVPLCGYSASPKVYTFLKASGDGGTISIISCSQVGNTTVWGNSTNAYLSIYSPAQPQAGDLIMYDSLTGWTQTQFSPSAGDVLKYSGSSWAAGSLSASDVGAIATPASPSSGDFLVWSGSAWVAQSLSTWQGGSY